MAILNIDQFIERSEGSAACCSKCSGTMKEIPIKTFDAIKFIFGRKKIIKRFKCKVCNNEIKIEI